MLCAYSLLCSAVTKLHTVGLTLLRFRASCLTPLDFVTKGGTQELKIEKSTKFPNQRSRVHTKEIYGSFLKQS